jgi:hypothetical protein
MKPFLLKHARFIVVLIVMLVILVIANGEFSDLEVSIEQKRAQARSLFQANYRALFSDAVKFDGEPATMQGRRIQDQTQNITQVAQARAQKMVFETAPEYTLGVLPENASTDDQFAKIYQRRDRELQRELGFQRYFAIDVSDPKAFGFTRPDGGGNYSSADIAGYLRKLDIVRTVTQSVDRTGVAQINSLQFTPVDETLSSRGVPTKAALAGERPYLSGEGLVIKLRATELALYNFMLDLQRPGKGELKHRYLSVEKFKFEKPDLLAPNDNLIDVTMTVVAWRVNEDSSYPVDESAQQQQQATNQPRRFR